MARSKRDKSQPRERKDLQETDSDEPNGPYPQVSGESAPSSRFEEMQQWFRRARDKSQKWRQEATTCYDFVAGRQWSEEDIAKLELESRPVVTFNRIGSVADSVMGLEISNRQEVRFIPRQQGASGVNELLTEAGKWVRDECNAEDEESDAFSDLIICGMGCCLSGDTIVAGGEVKLATARLYSGRIVEIDLENGKKLTGTANHPVLTDRGWKSLIMLQEGDNLVSGDFLKGVQGFPVEKFNDVESRFEDVVNTFSAGREALWAATPANHFYGDGVGSEVHVVYADGALFRKAAHIASLQKIKNALFVRNFNRVRALGVGLLSSSYGVRPLFAAEGHSAFNIAHSPFSHGLGGFVISKLMPSGPKSFSDSFSVNARDFRNLVSGKLFRKIKANGFFKSDLGLWATTKRPERMTGSAQSLSDNCVGYTDLLGDFHEWKPTLEVEASKLRRSDGILSQFVTRVKRRIVRIEHDFPVYDLGTSTGMFIAGGVIVSNTETRIDYDLDPDGQLIIDRTDPLEMLWDASASKRNLMDARHIFRVRQIGIEQAEAMLEGELDAGDITTVDLDAVWAKDILTDGMQPHDATIAPYYRVDQAPNIDKRTSLITMVEVQWWEHVTEYRVADPTSGKAVKLDKKEFKTYSERAKMLGMPVISAPMKTRKYHRALLGSKILKEWDGPEKGGFTYKFMTGKRDRNTGSWYGLVRAMMDPQKWANKWLAQVMHIINSNAKGGVMAEAGAFENPQEAETTWSSPASITIVNDGAIERIKEKPSVQFPQGIDHLMQFAISSIRDVSGVNLELLGMANKEQAGILEHQRKQAGMTILAGFFDALREYRKNQGQLMLYYITNFLSDGRLIRIGGKDQAQYVPLVHEPGLVEYDVIVDQTPTSPNQKEATWIVLTQMMPFLAKMGLPAPVLMDLLECSPLPTALVAKIRQKLDELAKQPKPPNPDMIRAQAEVQKAQIGMQTAQIKGQADGIKAQAAMAKAQGDMLAGQQQGEQAKADVFLTYAQGAKAIADAQATQMQPQFSAIELLMGALDQAHQQSLANRVQDSAEAGQQHDQHMAEEGHDLAKTGQKQDHNLAVKQANKPAARPSA